MKRTAALEATAYHEAGHAVAAFRLNVRIRAAGISIVPDKDTSGRAHLQNVIGRIRLDVEDSDRAQIRAEKRALIALAGPAAQRKFNPRSVRKYHAAGDIESAVSVLDYFASGKELELYYRLIKLRAEKLVSHPHRWFVISFLAEALLEATALNGEEATRTIRAGHAALLKRERGVTIEQIGAGG